jgi:hypothetical protein
MNIISKMCNKCKCEKEIVEFSISRQSKDGYQNKCKDCQSKYNASKIELNRIKEFKPLEKKYCYKCKTTKTIDNFHKDKTKDDGYNNLCKCCKKEKYLNNHQEEKEKRKIYNEKYKKDGRLQDWKIENRKTILEKQRNHYYKNRDKILELKRIYTKTDTAKISCKNKAHKRRAKIQEGTATTKELKCLVDITTNCYWCNCKLDKAINNGFHIDHYLPLSKNGTHTLDNIVISCPTCNMKKGSKDPFEFATTLNKLF